MNFLLIIVSAGLAAAAFALAAFLLAETVLALFPASKKGTGDDAGSVAVVMPAHNESATIKASLENVRAQLRETDRLIVVADNCDDNTADIALEHGAEALIRNDPENRGKGYALQYAIDVLRAAPPEIVVFADADCIFDDGALQRIAALAAQENRPVQALYLMKAPEEAGPRLQAAEFAWLFMNKVRMSGLQRLFGVTRFTGSGFAIPWRQIENVELASGEIVEDLALTFQLARAGAPPMLAEDAIVTSMFPESNDALTRQSARWSLGSLRYGLRSFISLMEEGVKSGKLLLIGAAADLIIPPLTVFAALLFGMLAFGLFVWLFTGFSGAFSLSLWALALTGLAIASGWAAFGRKALPPSAIGGLGEFLLSKLQVFGEAGRESAKRWTPTRKPDDAEPRS